MRKAQAALEYLFMLAAVLALIAIAARVILTSTKNINQAIANYTQSVREQILENL
ncbi:class III signal peptide-containing protein [Thermococcus sp.]